MKKITAITVLILSGILFCLTHAHAQTPDLDLSGTHSISATGSHQDFRIPAVVGNKDQIKFELRGADGGRRKVRGALGTGCTVKGGKGANVVVRFRIGTGANELKPGGKIRFVVGKKGESNTSSKVKAAGGGGGTAVLYLDPSLSGNPTCSRTISGQSFNLPANNINNASSCWVLLAVAGGGGGAYSSGACGGSSGKGGNSGTSGSDGKGLGHGDGGSNGSPGGGGGNCGGAGLVGLQGCGADGGGLNGGNGQNGSQDGGFGYGGGSAGGGSTSPVGGGGGGYSGGGDGGLWNGGGGGGSFANSAATYSRKTSGDATRSPDNGKVWYTFRNIDPDVPEAVCQDITVQLNPNGSTTFNASQSDGGSTDPLGRTLSFCYSSLPSCPSSVTWGCNKVGEQEVRLRVEANGDSSTCIARIVVEDPNAPTASCQNIQVNLDEAGEGTFAPSDIDNGSMDLCDGSNLDLVLDTTQVDCNSLNSGYTVTLTAYDQSDNYSSCTALVTPVDNIPPTAKCTHTTVSLSANGLNPTIFLAGLSAGSSDNCAGIAPSSGGFTASCNNLGPNTVTITVSEFMGNLSSTCTSLITVIDPHAPKARCQSATVYLDATGIATVHASDVNNGSNDNCSIETMAVSLSTFDCADMGSLHTATFTVTDPAGNTDDCTASVTVLDGINPSLSCPANQTIYTGSTACTSTYSIPDPVSDNCSGPTWGATFSGNANGLPSSISGIADGVSSSVLTFELGATTVMLNGIDGSGNAATGCSFTVTVEDNILPLLTCPSNQIIKADDNACVANYLMEDPISDNCTGATWGASFTGNLPPLSGISDGNNNLVTFPKGTTTITLNGTDGSTNAAATCSFTLTVNDSTPPTINCPNNIVKNADPGSCSTFIEYTISRSDNCSSLGSGLQGKTYTVGVTPKTYEAIDAAGNTANCSFTITVVDAENPFIICPAPITVDNDLGQCGAVVSYSVTSTDNCNGVSHVQTDVSGFTTGDEFPVGTTTQTYTATDGAGNRAICSFDITVNDTIPPVINCPPNRFENVSVTCTIGISYGYSVNDNCMRREPKLGDGGFSVGVTPVTLTAADPSGNTSSCTFTVTIVDVGNPTINCPTNISVENDHGKCGAMVDYMVSSADNCSATHVQTDVTGFTSGDEFPLGTTTQSYEAADPSGNTSACSFTVTVSDQEGPAFNCPTSNIVRNTDPSACDHLAIGTDLDPQVTDNCQVLSVVNDLTNTASLGGSVFGKGKTLVTWTATDIHGNSSVCSYHIKIRDREAPVFDNCPAGTTLVVPAYTPGAYHTWPALTATDNCNPSHKLTISGFPLSGSYFPVGTTTVNWTVTDKSNNDAPCQFDVTVVETGDPAPNGWTGNSVGNSNSCHTNYNSTSKTLTIQSTGGNVSMSADNFCGVTIPNSSGIIDFRARVTPAGAGYYDQAGIMMRESLANNAKHATMLLTGTSVPMMSLRASAGGFPLSTSGTAVTKPYWLRLYRAGGTITGYVSADGVNWSSIMSYPNLLSSPLYLVLFSTTSGTLGQATFDHITINGAAARLGDEAMGTELTLKAYPNPFSEDLFIDVENALPGETYNVRLSNMLGQRVYGYETGASPEGKIAQRISLEHLAAGTYLLEVSAGVQRKSIKVVKN